MKNLSKGGPPGSPPKQGQNDPFWGPPETLLIKAFSIFFRQKRELFSRFLVAKNGKKSRKKGPRPSDQHPSDPPRGGPGGVWGPSVLEKFTIFGVFNVFV